MKNIIRKTVTAASFIIAIATSSFSANAQDGKLIYNKNTNPSIGITVENATGANYVVKDEKGNIVLQGKVKSNKTFFIPTAKLNTGAYQFFIGNLPVQQFNIK